jgi:hypothetical protein
MKSNKYKFWKIELHGPKAGDLYAARFHGRIDGALAEADELECEVDFDITKIVVALDSDSSANQNLVQPAKCNNGHPTK